MRSILRFRGGARLFAVSAMVLSLAAALLLLSSVAGGARPAEAGDAASLAAALRSFEVTASTAPVELDATAAQQTTAAAVDYFLKIDGIPGESTDDRHRDAIEVLSFSWGVANSAPGAASRAGGGGAGKANFQDFQFSARTSKASPALFLAAATGQHIPSAVLTVRKAGAQQEYMTITLTDVLVSSYQTGGSADTVPTEEMSLNYSKIEFEYRPQNPDGSLGAPVKTGYDLKINKKV